MIQALYENSANKVITRNNESTEFYHKNRPETTVCCVLSPLLFSIVLDDALRRCKGNCKSMFLGFWRMKTIQLQDVLFADDIVIVAESEEKLQHNVKEYQKELSGNKYKQEQSYDNRECD